MERGSRTSLKTLFQSQDEENTDKSDMNVILVTYNNVSIVIGKGHDSTFESYNAPLSHKLRQKYLSKPEFQHTIANSLFLL